MKGIVLSLSTYRALVAQIADVHGPQRFGAPTGRFPAPAAVGVVPWSPRSIPARLWRP
jgi:hypothetical protein